MHPIGVGYRRIRIGRPFGAAQRHQVAVTAGLHRLCHGRGPCLAALGDKLNAGAGFHGRIEHGAPAPLTPGAFAAEHRERAQWEREATAERTSAALQVLKAQGRATGGVAPYGFQFIDGRREWHQGEQETLAAIIEHRRAGLSWAKVAYKLNATGHRTRTSGQWTRQGAHQVHQARERDDQAAA